MSIFHTLLLKVCNTFLCFTLFSSTRGRRGGCAMWRAAKKRRSERERLARREEHRKTQHGNHGCRWPLRLCFCCCCCRFFAIAVICILFCTLLCFSCCCWFYLSLLLCFFFIQFLLVFSSCSAPRFCLLANVCF